MAELRVTLDSWEGRVGESEFGCFFCVLSFPPPLPLFSEGGLRFFFLLLIIRTSKVDGGAHPAW